MCADLSGFTRLSERFTAVGRHGAEEVSAVLDATFTAVLGPAIDSGGDVVAFGGDAATIAFTGDEHGTRAVAAAAAMQQALASINRPLTPARVRLRMTIGVATGPLVAALVGDRQRALVVLGDAVSMAVQLQHAASPGQVLVADPQPMAPPGARWGPAPAGVSARRLDWRKAGTVRAGTDPHRVSGPPVDALLPAALRAAIGGSRAPGELRRTTTAFVVAPHLTTDDVVADQTKRRLHELVAAIETASERWGVCWLATDLGDGSLSLILTAGAPAATTHDEERMVGAIGSILESIPRDWVRVGLERGVVFAGDVGHPARRAWTVIGDSVNVAARLAAAARPGWALAGPQLRAAVPHVFTGAALTTLSVKGRRGPVTAVAFDRPRPLRPPVTESGGALIGRDAELAQLRDAWARARAGQGRAVEVVGESGMGTTRLLAEVQRAVLADDVPSQHITHVVPGVYRAAAPYAVTARVLRDLAGVAEDAPPDAAGALLAAWVGTVTPDLLDWLPLLARAANARVEPTAAVDRLDPAFVPDRTRDLIVDVLSAARTEPWLLVVEDLHRVDAASRDVLKAIAKVAPDRSWLICTSVAGDDDAAERSGIASAVGATVVRLGPLAPDEATALVLAAAEPVALADDVLARIVETAEGNPLFLEQLARHSVGVDPEVPDSLERLLAARIDTLPPADRHLLRELSVLGRTGPAALAATWLGRPDLVDPGRWERLRDFVAVETDADGEAILRFASDLLRTVAYDGLSVRHRRSLHAQVARHFRGSLGDGDDLGQLLTDADDATVGLLATHLLESGDADAAWPVAVHAARRARDRVALVDADALYARALRLAPRLAGVPPIELATVHEERGDVCLSLGRFDLALEAFRAASGLLADPVDRARLCGRRAYAEQRRGGLSRAAAWATRGLRMLEGVKTEQAMAMRAQLALDQAATHLFQGRNRESARWAERAAADALATDDLRLLANAHLHLEMAHSVLGDGLATGYGKKAIALFEELGDDVGLGHALTNTGLTAYDEGRWAEARAAYERAAEVAATTGNVTQKAATQVNMAYLLAELGETDEAAALSAAARRTYRATGNDFGLAYVEFLSARLALWSGDTTAARDHFAEARRLWEADGARQLVLDCDVSSVEVLLVEGDDVTALREATRLRREVDAFGPAELLPVIIRRSLSHAARRTGDADTALAVAREAVEVARDLGARMELALSLDVVAHAERALGREPDPDVVAERDEILRGLGVQRTIFPLA